MVAQPNEFDYADSPSPARKPSRQAFDAGMVLAFAAGGIAFLGILVLVLRPVLTSPQLPQEPPAPSNASPLASDPRLALHDDYAQGPPFATEEPTVWDGVPNVWYFSNGVLLGRYRKDLAPGSTYLTTQRRYADWEWSFAVRLSQPNLRVGVLFRGLLESMPNFANPPGVELEWGDGRWGVLVDRWQQRDCSGLPQLNKPIDPTQWNDLRIRCVGQRLTVSVNGETTIDAAYRMPPTGILAWKASKTQAGDQVQYRNIRFRELEPRPEWGDWLGPKGVVAVETLRNVFRKAWALPPIEGGLTWSDDGRWLAVPVRSQERSVVWLIDAKTGQTRHQLFQPQDRERYHGCAFGHGNRWLAVAGGDSLRIWDVESGQLIRDLPIPRPAYAVAFQPNGKRLAVSGHGFVRCYATDSWAEQFTASEFEGISHGVAFEPNGHWLVSSHTEGFIRLRHCDHGETIGTLAVSGNNAGGVAVHPTGAWLVAGNATHVRLWSADGLRDDLQTFPHLSANWQAFAPDGKTFWVGGWQVDSTGATLHQFDLKGHLRRALHLPEVQGEVRSALSPEGKRLAVAAAKALAVIDLEQTP